MRSQTEFTENLTSAFPGYATGASWTDRNDVLPGGWRIIRGSPATPRAKRSKMRTIRDNSLISVTTAAFLALAASVLPVHAQTAADAALNMANMLDGAGGGGSGGDLP